MVSNNKGETLEGKMKGFWEKWKPNTRWMISDPDSLKPEFMQDLHALCTVAARGVKEENEILRELLWIRHGHATELYGGGGGVEKA